MTLGSGVARIRNPSCRLAEHVKAGKTHQKSCGWELPETLVRLLDAPSASGVAKKPNVFLKRSGTRNNLLPCGRYTVYAKGTHRQEDFCVKTTAKCLILLRQHCLWPFHTGDRAHSAAIFYSSYDRSTISDRRFQSRS
jgi:hypothetical protein